MFTFLPLQAIARIDSMAEQTTDSIKRIEKSIAPATSAIQSLSSSSEPVTAAIKGQSRAIEENNRTLLQMSNSGIKSVRGGLQDIGDSSRKIGKELRWAGFASTMLARLGVIGGRTGAIAKVLGGIMSATGKEMKAYGFYAQVLGKNYDETAKSTEAVAVAHTKAEKTTKKLSESTMSLAGNLSGTALLGAVAWKAGLDEIVEASGKWLKSDSELMKAVNGTASVLAEAVEQGFNMFTEGVEGSVNAVIKFVTGFDSITDIVDAVGAELTDWAQFAEENMIKFGKAAQEAGLIFGAALGIFQSGGNFDAGKYIEEGRELIELAEQTAATMAKQNTLKATLSLINDAAGKAASDARTKNELARIATLQSVEAIDQEILAMKLAANTTDEATQKNKNWRREQDAKAAALGKRKQDLVDGGTSTGSADTTKAIEAARKKLSEMTMGEDALAIATARANGATEEQLNKLRSLQDDLAIATDAQETQKKVDEANDKAAEQIQELRDKYDELTGALTKADIAKRKLLKEGVSSALAEETRALTEQIAAEEKKQKEEEKENDLRKKFADQIAGLQDTVAEASGEFNKGDVAYQKALREGATEEEAQQIGEATDAAEEAKKKENKGKSKESENQAVLAGTAEAAKIAFGGSSKLESLAEKQIAATKDVVKAINNKDEVELGVVEGL